MNYKDTIQYRNDNKLFKIWVGVCIGYYLIMFLTFLWAFFFLWSGATFEIALTVFLFGIIFYFLIDLFYIAGTIKIKEKMKTIESHMDEAYVCEVRFKEPIRHWLWQCMYSVSFPYQGGMKTARTSRLFYSECLDDSLVEVGYIESLDELIVIRKVESDR